MISHMGEMIKVMDRRMAAIDRRTAAGATAARQRVEEVAIDTPLPVNELTELQTLENEIALSDKKFKSLVSTKFYFFLM